MVYLSHPHQSSFQVLPRDAHHCRMLKILGLGSSKMKLKYLNRLGKIVSIFYVVFLNPSVFCCFTDSCNSIQCRREALLWNPLDRWRTLHYQGIFPHSNCFPIFISKRKREMGLWHLQEVSGDDLGHS